MITLYKCSFCGYVHGNKKRIVSHEHRCYMNPKNKHCATCVNLIFDVSAYYCETLKKDKGQLDPGCFHWKGK